MSSDIQNLAAAAEANPKDTLTIQALADALEELGANAESVRALTVDGPTMLLIGYPEGRSSAEIARLEECANALCQFLSDHSGYTVGHWCHRSDITIRAIRAGVAEKKE